MFAIGDRVECIVNHPDNNDYIVVGSIGTVCEICDDDDDAIGVCWDDMGDSGHDCGGNCKSGHGWRVYPNQIILYQECDDTPYEFDEQLFNNLIYG